MEQSLRHSFGFSPELSFVLVLEGRQDIAELRQRIRDDFPDIRGFQRIQSLQDHRHQLYHLTLDTSVTLPESQNWVLPIRKLLKDWQAETGQKGYLSGSVGFMYDTNTAAHSESAMIEKIALALAFIILIFNFGSLLSSLLPILMGATSLLYLAVCTQFLHIQITPITMVLNSMVGLALAIDYSLFMVSRFNEELANGQASAEALETTFRHSGETILFSALVMVCSISVLLIPDVSSAHIVVQGLSLVIALSLVVTLLILPSVLLVGQPWLDRPRFLTSAIRRVDKYTFWKRFSEHVVAYPKRYFWGSLLALLVLAAPALKMELWEPFLLVTPHHSDSFQGYQALKEDGWGGELMPINVIVHAPAGQSIYSPESLAFIQGLSDFALAHPKVESVLGLTSWQKDFSIEEYAGFYSSMEAMRSLGVLAPNNPVSRLVDEGRTVTLINVYPDKDLNVKDAYQVIDELRAYALKNTSMKIDVGGMVARARDFTRAIYRHTPLMLAGVLLSIFLILFIYMRAVVLPIKAALMNFMPILGAYGVLVLVFQYGWGSSVLQLPQQGGITALVPVVLFCIVFGLSMDYEVLILSRISESYHAGYSVKESVVEGLARSGSVITGAAFILLGVFVPGLFAPSPLVKEIALGLTVAMILDATLLRLFLVPSFMLLMGEWNWWNPFVRKQKNALEKAESPEF